MKTVALYANRNVGLIALTTLLAKGFKVILITEDRLVSIIAAQFGVKESSLEKLPTLEFDLFLCVHGRKILPQSYLREGKMVNIHPCLKGYPGTNPIKRYIETGDVVGTVDAHYMTAEVDKGEVIYTHKFATGKCSTYADFYNIAIPFYMVTVNHVIERILQ